MAMMRAETDQMRTEGKQVVDSADGYLTHVKELYDIVDNLRDNWQGDSNISFVNQLNGYKENINALGQVEGNYGVFIQETANSLDKLNAEIAAQATKL